MGISYNFSHFHTHIQEPQKSLSEKVRLKIGGLQIHLHMYMYNTVNIKLVYHWIVSDKVKTI